MAKVGLRPEYLSPLSAHVLGRPAPAHRHRPRADAAGRRSWCSTSRCRRSTCRSARRCSTCSPSLQEEFGLAYVFISHDLVGRPPHRRRGDGDLSRPCGRDRARARRSSPRRSTPIRSALLSATPVADPTAKRERILLKGEPPSPIAPPPGCPFNPRCPLAFDRCRMEKPPLERQAGTRRRVLGGARRERDATTSSSSAPARPAACSPTASPPIRAIACCCSKRAAATTGSGCTFRSAISSPSAIRAPTGGSRPRAEPGLNGRAIAYPRGRVVGGSSAINGMIYMRGQAADYDGWRQLGLDGWGWDDVLPFFKRHEDHHGGADALHGAGGEWRIERPRMSLADPRRGARRGGRGRHRQGRRLQPRRQRGLGLFRRQPAARAALERGARLPQAGPRPRRTCGSSPARMSSG